MTRHEQSIRKWLQALGLRCAQTLGFEDAEVKLATYVPALADLSDGVFCDTSLEDVSRQFDYFPSYAALRKALDKWWDVHKPRPPSLPGDDDPSLTDEDRSHLAVWTKRRVHGFLPNVKLADLPAEPAYIDQETFRRRMTVSLDIMRHGTLARVYRYICRHDTEAAAVAVHRGWEVDTVWPRPERTPDEVEHVRHAVVEASTAIHRANIPREVYRSEVAAAGGVAAAQAEIAAAHEKFRQQHGGRNPGELSAERLAAQRAADPAVQKARAHQEAGAAERSDHGGMTDEELAERIRSGRFAWER